MSRRVITMRALGAHGRFGNQLFQYAFLRTYAAQHNLEYQVPQWAGQYLFGTQDPRINVVLADYSENRPQGYEASPAFPQGEEFCGKNFMGYAQFHTAWYRPHREFITSLFQPTARIRERLAPGLAALRARGGDVVGLHFRRGDYGRGIHYLTPVRWYAAWLEEHWDSLRDPVLFVATEDEALYSELARYAPQRVEDLGIELSAKPYPYFRYLAYDVNHPTPRGMDFYPDFYMLTQSDVLLMPNSTFSFCAAMLNSRLPRCWRSHLPTQRFVQVDPWDGEPITYDKVEDYPDAEGVKLARNPHWESRYN